LIRRQRSHVTGGQIGLVRCRRQNRTDSEILAQTDEEEPFAKLRNTVPSSVEHGIASDVPPCGYVLGGIAGYVPSIDREHSRDVLHDNRQRFPQLRNVEESPVELVSSVTRITLVGEAV